MEERRSGMEELKNKIDKIQSYLESEFGGTSLSGHSTEGNTSRNFREINAALISLRDVIKIQNGRISKLENWKSYIIGIGGSAGGILALITLIIEWIKK